MKAALLGALLVLLFSIVVSKSIFPEDHNDSLEFVKKEAPVHKLSDSLSIAGDLKSLKLKSSIDQLVRALKDPVEHDPRGPKKPELKSPTTQLITKHTLKRAKNLSPIVPEPVVISSEPIKVTSGSNRGGKKARSLVTVGSDNVKVIEGVRVPDDEMDKHYTWRNARVIKNFLVPKGDSPNPHRKRQTATSALTSTELQKYISQIQQQELARQQEQLLLQQQSKSMPQQSQSSLDGRYPGQYDQATHHAQQLQQHQPLSRAQAYNTQNPLAQQQTQQLQQPVPQHMQQQQQAQQLPQQQTQHLQQHQLYSQNDGLLDAQSRSSQPNQFMSADEQQKYLQMYKTQDPGTQMYVLQPDGKTYLPVNGEGGSTSTVQPAQRRNLYENSPINPGQSLNDGTTKSVNLGVIQPQVQQTQAPQYQQMSSPIQTVTQQPVEPLIQRAQQVPLQDAAQITNDVLAAAARILQQQQQISQYSNLYNNMAQVYDPQSQYPPISYASNRQSEYGIPGATGGVIIQPQTYVTGPAGQAVTVPVPVQLGQGKDSSNNQDSSSKNLSSRINQALQINKRTMEVVEKTALLPALASTGLLLGIGAVAAGWYLSKSNREVGIVRRSGLASGGSSKIHKYRPEIKLGAQKFLTRKRREVYTAGGSPEVDQSAFFQNIIQQSLEQQQKEIEESTPETQLYHETPTERHDEYQERHGWQPPQKGWGWEPPSKGWGWEPPSKGWSPPKKHSSPKPGRGWGMKSNFAKVAIPSLVMGTALIGIVALIFGWYIAGSNREIAFLEPTAVSRRRKRSLMTSTDFSNTWLMRVLKAIHRNPYERMQPYSSYYHQDPLKEVSTSKNSQIDFKISNEGLSSFIAGGAILAIIAIGMAHSFGGVEDASKSTKARLYTPSGAQYISNPLTHLRAPRYYSNDLSTSSHSDPYTFAHILQKIDDFSTHGVDRVSSSIQDDHSCTKKFICRIMSLQKDDTLKLIEKKIPGLTKLLPNKVSGSMRKTMTDIIFSASKHDCSSYTCDMTSDTI